MTLSRSTASAACKSTRPSTSRHCCALWQALVAALKATASRTAEEHAIDANKSVPRDQALPLPHALRALFSTVASDSTQARSE
eukprot:CAMPEP_0172841626 /NCGR_PEP_ID=MMETSP1075-20121228/30121_1 /TAXON_ID=2916 /ORGANISM="Ceratium fusus, Strain PA161109" /LENGTH=82 /DNA_ID=CAMNT_0013685627 /DNA_START=5 /DNA_END=250 /DNA_ORIENTATION=+